jgi:hypothetical protein
MEPSDALHDFRRSFYGCLYRRGDALFELTDAILSTDTAYPSPVRLSLQPAHQRGWGSRVRKSKGPAKGSANPSGKEGGEN